MTPHLAYLHSKPEGEEKAGDLAPRGEGAVEGLKVVEGDRGTSEGEAAPAPVWRGER